MDNRDLKRRLERLCKWLLNVFLKSLASAFGTNNLLVPAHPLKGSPELVVADNSTKGVLKFGAILVALLKLVWVIVVGPGDLGEDVPAEVILVECCQGWPIYQATLSGSFKK